MRRHFGFKHRYAYKYLEIEDFTERPFGNTGRREIATKVAVKNGLGGRQCFWMWYLPILVLMPMPEELAPIQLHGIKGDVVPE